MSQIHYSPPYFLAFPTLHVESARQCLMIVQSINIKPFPRMKPSHENANVLYNNPC